MKLKKIGISCVFAAVAAAVCFNPAAAIAEEPEFRLLRLAQHLYGDGAHEIRLVQAEDTAAEINQPTDLGSRRSTFTGLRDGDIDEIGELDFSDLFKPDLSSGIESTLNTPTQIADIELVTGQSVDTGLVATAPVEILPASTFSLVNIPDVAETIVSAGTTPTVKARRRSPLAMEARIRGYQGGQIYTMLDGGFQGPVRNDLDGMLNKVDQSLIGSTQVISGPYGLRYGSGFSFINIDTIPTPRNEGGWENHVRMGTNVRTNGGQTYNTATVLGGGERAGYYASVGYRKGSDYDAGNGLAIPSSYDAFNLFSAFGFDIDDVTRLETKVSILDQSDTEYAGQFFDVNELTHEGITQSLIHQDDQSGFGYRVDGWYSQTDFAGDANQSGKRRPDFPVVSRVESALSRVADVPPPPVGSARFLADVNGDLVLAGFRAGVSQSFGEGSSISAGTDMRYIQQRIQESYDISQFISTDALFTTGLPTAEVFDPGLYIEASTAITPYWTVATGARVAFASTQANGGELRDNSNFRDFGGDVNRDLDVSDTLASWYLTNDVELNPHWRTRVGVGYAEALPDLTNRYADGVFLSVIQSGFSRVIGNPELNKERNYQVDVRLDGDYENVRTRFSAFHSWIHDYNTYEANAIRDPFGARLLTAVNTEYATLAGFEYYGEADLLDGVQMFSGMSYLDGRDREIHQPLGGISPLEGRIGLRLVDTQPANRWGLEWGWRIVDNQDRLASYRPTAAAGPGAPAIELETATPGFTTSYLRSYLRPNDTVSITAGVENLFDKNYFEHLNLRLPADPINGFGETVVLSPGVTPYFGVEVEY